jgi:oligopeptide transport system substrate-binding protein
MRRTILPFLLVCVVLSGCGKRTNTVARTDMLRYPIKAEPSSFDPVTITDPATLDILQNLYEGLVMFDETNKTVPCLAEKWDISKDGLTYTFHLRPGVKFHNGRTMTSADVKWSFERTLWPDTKSPVAAGYLAGIVGVDDVASGKRKDLEGVTLPDPQTVVIKLKKPRGLFLGELAYNTAWIFCREAIEKANGRIDETSAIGTGPFKLAAYQHGSKVILDAFPEYWDGKPKLSRIERPIVIDPQVRHVKYENSEIDRCEISLDDYVNDGKSAALKDERKLLPQAAVTYLAMGQLAQPVFRDKRVRLAFAEAIDRDAIVATAYRGLSPRADGFLPPGLPGNQPDFPHIPYNPESARKLLAEAGFPGGKGFPTMALTYTQKEAEFAAAAQIIRDNLKTNLGITIDVQEREAATFLADARAKKLGFHLNTWYADYLDPQNFLTTLLRTGAAVNRVSYSNPQFDALCDAADTESDPAKRIELYKQADKLAMSEAPLLPLVYPNNAVLIKPYVKDFPVNLMGSLPQRKTRIQR